MAIKMGLSNGNYKWIAMRLSDKSGHSIEPEMVIAFSKVECKRAPFDDDGFPAILFERHKFYKNAPRSKRDIWYKQYPDICNPNATKAGKYGSYADQRVRFSRAFRLDPDAAMEACSWGAFQELGENYQDYGFKNVGEFVDTMKNGLYGQCDIFIKSIIHRGLADDMQNLNFATLARVYNGPNYKKFKYDEQLKFQYNEEKKVNTDWLKVTAIAPAKKRISIPITQFLTPLSSLEEIESSTPDSGDSEGGRESGLTAPSDINADTEIKVTRDEIHISTESPESAKPKAKVAIEKTEPSGFWEGLWKRITAVFGGNVGFEVIADKAQQAGALGLSPTTWKYIGWLVLIGGIIYLVSYIYDRRKEKQREENFTKLLIEANSTPDNYVQLVPTDQLDIYRQKGYKVITR